MASNPLTDLLNDRTKRQTRTVGNTHGRYTVATTSPFTVYLNGSDVAVPAKHINGLTYNVGDHGDYIKAPGSKQAICLPTV